MTKVSDAMAKAILPFLILALSAYAQAADNK